MGWDGKPGECLPLMGSKTPHITGVVVQSLPPLTGWGRLLGGKA